MDRSDLKHGDLVQINPERARNLAFAGLFLVVTDTHLWGVYGYIPDVAHVRDIGRVVWYRAGWEEIEHIGKARFLLQD